MDQPTRRLDRPAPAPAPESQTRAFSQPAAAAAAPPCARCGGPTARARLRGAKLQFGSDQSVPRPAKRDVFAQVCVDCGYTELYAGDGA
jgi:hypothetical protein